MDTDNDADRAPRYCDDCVVFEYGIIPGNSAFLCECSFSFQCAVTKFCQSDEPPAAASSVVPLVGINIVDHSLLHVIIDLLHDVLLVDDLPKNTTASAATARLAGGHATVEQPSPPVTTNESENRTSPSDLVIPKPVDTNPTQSTDVGSLHEAEEEE